MLGNAASVVDDGAEAYIQICERSVAHRREGLKLGVHLGDGVELSKQDLLAQPFSAPDLHGMVWLEPLFIYTHSTGIYMCCFAPFGILFVWLGGVYMCTMLTQKGVNRSKLGHCGCFDSILKHSRNLSNG